MFTRAHGQEPILALELARLQLLLRSADYQQRVSDAILATEDSIVYSTVGSSDPTYPPFYYCECGGTNLMLVSCTQSLAMARAIAAGWVLPRQTGFNGLINAWADEAATQVDVASGRGSVPASSRRIFCGYSAGGMVAEVLGQRWAIDHPNDTTIVVTFGSPRVGDRAFGRQEFRQTRARYMTYNDGVPQLPPRTVLDGPIGWLTDSATITTYNRFVHGSGGVLIDFGGRLTPAEVPTGNLIQAAQDLAAFLVSQVRGNDTGHSIATYVNLLSLQLPQDTGGTVVGGSFEEPSPITRREIVREVAARVQTIFNQGAQQQVPGEVIQPGGKPFVAFRVGKVWSVRFGDTVIATGPTKRRARGLANVGNAMCSRLQRAALVDGNALPEQLANFIAAASVPGNGYVPPIRTTLPAG